MRAIFPCQYPCPAHGLTRNKKHQTTWHSEHLWTNLAKASVHLGSNNRTCCGYSPRRRQRRAVWVLALVLWVQPGWRDSLAHPARLWPFESVGTCWNRFGTDWAWHISTCLNLSWIGFNMFQLHVSRCFKMFQQIKFKTGPCYQTSFMQYRSKQAVNKPAGACKVLALDFTGEMFWDTRCIKHACSI